MNSEIKLNEQKSIDLSTLIDTRLLIQANSGGGKSWCIRRILEQSHGKVQQIVIDLEGEFSSLREKYDYVLAGKGGDTPADPRSAALLAKRLLELNVSAIIDLYELDQFNRKRFVRLFLDALVNARKELWHPALIVIDEAHVFCPEKGQAESAGSVIDLATRGRKRGYSAILATQRISKLHKDAAAECNNKLIGRTGLDIDRKRASEELGFTGQEQSLSLRTLEAGEFFAFGPAISSEVIKVKIGSVFTTHPKAGSRILTKEPAPPTDKIRSVLGKLADLPKEAVEEAQTIESLKRENAQLKRGQKTIQVERITEEGLKKALEPHLVAFRSVEQDYKNQIKILNDYIDNLEWSILAITEKARKITEDRPDTGKMSEYVPLKTDRSLPALKEMSKKHDEQILKSSAIPAGDKPIIGGALRMLQVLASRYPMTFSKSQLATLSKLSPRSGTFGTYFSALKSNNYITVDGNIISITDAGLQFIGSAGKVEPQTTQETIDMWRSNLTGGARKIFDHLVEIYPQYTTKENLGADTGYSHTSGTFGTYISMLRSNGLIETVGGTIKASDTLFI